MTARILELFQHIGGPNKIKIHAAQQGFTLCGIRVNGHQWSRAGEFARDEDVTCGTCRKKIEKEFRR